MRDEETSPRARPEASCGAGHAQSEIGSSAHAQPVEQVLRALDVDPKTGLTADEARLRHARYGANRLPRSDTVSLWRILADQVRSFLVWLLVGAAALSVLVGDAAESVAILIVIAINTAIGFATELRATRSMEALRRMASVR
ncbi:MAG: cation-transporting P-type ATPase, partial [Pseudomonadota bacterium]